MFFSDVGKFLYPLNTEEYSYRIRCL